MGSIITYKDALPYRDSSPLANKVNQISNMEIIKYQQERSRSPLGGANMTKAKEMKSDIGF